MKNRKRINQLADFFYSSNSSKQVPLRIAITLNQYVGDDLNKEELVELLDILFNSDNLKAELLLFRDKVLQEGE